jgi:hypothetical protein
VALLIIGGAVSIILGAFGATATINYQGVTLAGVAALSVVIFFIVIPEIRNPSVRVEITGFPHDSAVDFYAGRTHFLGAFRGDAHQDLYEFAVFADELKSKVLGVTVTPPKSDAGVQEKEKVFGCIDQKVVVAALGSTTSVQWKVDFVKGRLMEMDKTSPTLVSGVGSCGEEPEAPGLDAIAWSHLLSPFKTAIAGTVAAELALSFRDLTAESSPIRTNARMSIGAAGPSAIEPLMAFWRTQPSNYRVRLGSLVSLVEMMRSMKPERKNISAELKEDDLRLIVDAAGDDDRTIRIYATEFLYDLADPRSVSVIVGRMPNVGSDGQYNMALVLTSVAAEMSEADRSKLRAQLVPLKSSGFGEKTMKKLDAI